MSGNKIDGIFTSETLRMLFPEERTNLFFDAMYGDPTEGAYDIDLDFKKAGDKRLQFEFCLKQRPGKCMGCHLTYGLPEVFSRHPIIDVKGLVNEIERLLDGRARCTKWHLGSTHEVSRKLHVIPLMVELDTSLVK